MPSSGSPLPPVRLITHVSFIGFATALSARAVDPIIPPMALSLGVDPAKIALLSTAFTLPFAFVQPILGPIADLFGKVRIMMLCLVVIIAASLACALATSYEVVLAARIICGIASGGVFPVGMAIIADAVPVGERQVGIARWLAIVIAGNVLGSAFAGVVGDLFGWRAVFFVVAAGGTAGLANAVANLGHVAQAPATRPEWRSIPAGYFTIFANPRAKFCFLAVFLEGVAVFGLFPFVALLLMAAGEPRASIAGLVIAGFSIGGVLYSLAVTRLTRRWRPRDLMIGGGMIALGALATVAFDPPWPVQLAAFIVLGFGFYSLHGCIQVEASELTATARGTAMSLHSMFFFVGQATGPVLYGIGFKTLGAGPAVLLGGGVMLLVAVMCARYLGTRSPPAPAS
jgi:MFS transporter, DHA1 family, inner membrane transport protein